MDFGQADEREDDNIEEGSPGDYASAMYEWGKSDVLDSLKNILMPHRSKKAPMSGIKTIGTTL